MKHASKSKKNLLERMMSSMGVPKVNNQGGSIISMDSSPSKSSSQSLTNLTRAKATKATLRRRAGAGRMQPPQRPTLSRTNNVRASEWSFSVINLSREGQIEAASEMIYDMYIEMQKNPKDDGKLRIVVREFVEEVASRYGSSSYHNFTHAVDVTQMMFLLVTKYLKGRLKRQEGFYLVISALCHDISHPGAGSVFLRDQGCLPQDGTLEQYHMDQTKDLIENAGLKLFSPEFIRPDRLAELVDYTQDLIDATDILKNDKYLDAARQSKCKKNSMLQMEHLAILIKVSDLANVARDFQDGYSWSENLRVELLAEGLYRDAQANGLTMAMPAEDATVHEKVESMGKKLMTLQAQVRENNAHDLTTGLAEGTAGFIKAVTRPLAEILKNISEEAGEDYARRIFDSVKKWSKTRC